jgi:DNA repair protein RadC
VGLQIPESERPRERLLSAGVDALSLKELLAIVLGTGTKGKNVLMLAEELLLRFEDLKGLLEATVQELAEVKGIGKTKALLLQAVFGIAKKACKPLLAQKALIRTAKSAFELARSELGHHKQEVLLVILRDVKGRLIHHEKVSIGTLSEVLVHPREVFYPAIRHKAHSVILAHNHPSGDPTPSEADLNLTRLLLQSGRVVGIQVSDHLIIGSTTFTSLRERGFLGDSQIY